MKSKLTIAIILWGWLLFVAWIVYDYAEYQDRMIIHIFLSSYSLEHVTFYILIILMPFVYTVIGYLVNESEKFLERIKESEEKYRSLVESTEDSIYLIDRNCKYLFMNKKHISRLGLSGDEYLGQEYSKFHSPDETKWFNEKANQVFTTGESIQHKHESL
ncbi:MAG: PAS domain S-box protein, partial [Nitrospirota bacterium]|nr:PAS domain S-box protein [Nitrospirota bacterium]